MKPTTLAQCMDIFDWFDDTLYDYISHILAAKLDGEARVQRALGYLIDHAAELIAAHSGLESEYPDELLNQSA